MARRDGLISRSIGDRDGKTGGVIATPDVSRVCWSEERIVREELWRVELSLQAMDCGTRRRQDGQCEDEKDELSKCSGGIRKLSQKPA